MAKKKRAPKRVQTEVEKTEEKISKLRMENRRLEVINESLLMEKGEFQELRDQNYKQLAERREKIRELEKNLHAQATDIRKFEEIIKELKEVNIITEKEKAKLEGKIEAYEQTYRQLVEHLPTPRITR